MYKSIYMVLEPKITELWAGEVCEGMTEVREVEVLFILLQVLLQVSTHSDDQ